MSSPSRTVRNSASSSVARGPACARAKIAAAGSRRSSSIASVASSRARRTGSRCSMNERTSGRSSYSAGPLRWTCSSNANGSSAPSSSSRPSTTNAPRTNPRRSGWRCTARTGTTPVTRPAPPLLSTAAEQRAAARRGSRTRRAGSSRPTRRPERRRSARPQAASHHPPARAPPAQRARGAATRLGLAQRHERAAAALDVKRGLAVEQDDPRARNPRRPRAGTPRPRHRRAVRLRGIRGGEHERVRQPPSSPRAPSEAPAAAPRRPAARTARRRAPRRSSRGGTRPASREREARRRRRRTRRGSPRRGHRRASRSPAARAAAPPARAGREGPPPEPEKSREASDQRPCVGDGDRRPRPREAAPPRSGRGAW